MVLDGVFAQATLVIKPITVQHLPFEECLLQPEPTKAATHHPQPMKMNFFYHLNFLKQDKSPLKLF
jgi:hypothetical protein